MNIKVFNSLFKSISRIKLSCENKKKILIEMKEVNSEKRNRNEKHFKNMYKEITAKEQEIKTLSDNKFFVYSELKDFLEEDKDSNFNNFELLSSIGCVTKSTTAKVKVKSYSSYTTNDLKKIVLNFPNEIPVNEMNYSFYSADDTPIYPTQIFFSSSENKEEKFYEPNFRFFNRNNKSNENIYIFNPKRIHKLVFLFEKPINSSNFIANLYSNNYSINSSDYLEVIFHNEKLLNKMNLSKNTDETIIPLEFSYSIDGLNYKELFFNEFNEGILNTEKSNKIKVKIKALYNKRKIKEELLDKIIKIKSLENSLNSYSYSTVKNKYITSCSILLSFSSFKQLKERFIDDELDINEFINEENGIFKIKDEYISIVDSDEYINKNLELYDDVSVLKTDKKAFQFYLSKESGTLFCVAFMQDLQFIIQLGIKDNKKTIDHKYYTPSIYELSVKG